MYVFSDSCNRTQIQTVAKSDPIFWIERAGLPALVILCTIGNFLNIIVMAGEKPKIQSVHMVSKATKVFLMSMAVSDTLLLWFQVPTYIAEYVQNISYFDNSTAALGFKRFYGAQQWGSEAFLQWSDWILIAFSIDRLRAFHRIARSFRLKPNAMEIPGNFSVDADSVGRGGQFVVVRISNSSQSDGKATRAGFRRSTAVCLVIILLVGALIFSLENGVYYFYWRSHDRGDNKPFFTYRPDWLTDWNFYQTICEVAVTVAKFTILLLVNIHLIIIVISQRYQVGSPLTTRHGRRQSKEKTGTNLLVGCLLVYFFTHFPYVVFQCLRLAAGPPYCAVFLPVDTGMVARPIIRMVLYSNYSLNFLLYFALSKKFRDEFRLLPQRWQLSRQRWQQTFRIWCRCLSGNTVQRTRLATLTSTGSTSSTGTTITVAEKFL